MKLLSVEDARARMLDGAVRLGTEQVGLDAATGRVLAEPVVAGRDQPPFDASAMDGWAVRAADLREGGTELRIVGESAAGRGFAHALGAGEAVRISTGAPLPEGADRVVIQEEATRDGDTVRVGPAQGPGFVRARGADFLAGTVLLEAGVRLDPWSLALVASAGRATASVARRPRVAVLSTGEELVRAGTSAGPHAIYDAAGPAVAARAVQLGADAFRPEAAGDDLAAIMTAVKGLDCDLLVTIGGASVGDHDLVRPALARLGLALGVESVRVRPGKPTWFGVLPDGRRVLGLPGNPASALVCAELFLRPLLRALQGAEPALPMQQARLAVGVDAAGPREHWMRAVLSRTPEGDSAVSPMPDQDSSLVTVLADANALIRQPSGAPAMAAGALVDVLALDRA